jgi:hypothetical protein
MSTRRAHPAVTFFGTLTHQSVHFFAYRFAFEFHFGVTVPAISGRLEQHALAPKFRAEVASRLKAV